MERKISKFSGRCILLLAVSWVFEMATVGPVLGEIAKLYPDASMLLIQNIMTIPFLTGIPVSLVAGKLARRYNKKTLAIIGLIIYGIFGISPAFTTTIPNDCVSSPHRCRGWFGSAYDQCAHFRFLYRRA
jgi:MFS family permease